jgi:hypothetical protein
MKIMNQDDLHLEQCTDFGHTPMFTTLSLPLSLSTLGGTFWTSSAMIANIHRIQVVVSVAHGWSTRPTGNWTGHSTCAISVMLHEQGQSLVQVTL